MKWICGNKVLELHRRPLLMGIINATPDSFSGGCPTPDKALRHAERLISEGADILDIGGESTRPGSSPVSFQEEIDRVAPLIEGLRKITDSPLSIDTQKSQVAKESIALGVNIINHVSGTLDFKKMIALMRESTAGYLGMHMKSRPKIMQTDTFYENLVEDVSNELQAVQTFFTRSGVEPERLLFDPGIGFGKTTRQCIMLLNSIPHISNQLGRPCVIGLSRKRWIKELLHLDVGQRDTATATASALLPFPAAAIHRVHDVASTRQSLILKGLLEGRDWDWSSDRPIYTEERSALNLGNVAPADNHPKE